ncbi:uncharacterized protein LOC144921956 [Branchiostoma floridae x Branchiostoma belcheri]
MVAAPQFSFLVLLMAAMASSTSAATPTADTTTADTTTADTTAATTTLSTLAASSSPAGTASGSTVPAGSPTASGSTAAPGTGPTTTAAPGTAAPTTQSPILACLHCNGTEDSNDPCRTAAATTWNTNITCNTAAGCWVYREENSTSGDFTISRGCGRSDVNDGECTEQKQSEQCEEADSVGISVCRRCCTTAMCNDVNQNPDGPGSVGTPTAYVSTVVIVTSFIMAVFSNDLLL